MMPLNVTERAAEALYKTLEDVDRDPSQVLRLVSQADGLSLALDEQREDDQVIEYQGSAVMVLEPIISEQLSGVTIDYADTPEGGRLTIQRYPARRATLTSPQTLPAL
jgi:Fe-S cluster assembly iron-binding protein IscA